jgi:imidazolonepropionase-like amidohydrolase
MRIENGRIKEVGSPSEVQAHVPAGATIVDLGNATLLPWLIDSHTHLLLDRARLRLTYYPSITDTATEVVRWRTTPLAFFEAAPKAAVAGGSLPFLERHGKPIC